MRNSDLPPRLFETGGNFYWKPERRLRPKWKSAALGPERRTAIAEAKRLNVAVAEWLKREAAGAPSAKRKTRIGPATVSQLVADYKRSEDFRSLSPTTHVSYNYEFGRLELEFGHEIAAALTLRRVDDWLDGLRRKAPSTARHVLAKGRLLFQFAQRKELIPQGVNPFKGQRRLSAAKATAFSQGGRRKARFTWEEVRLIVTAADDAGLSSIGTALVIGFACVQRISDVIRLTRRHVAGGRLRFKQSKTGFDVDMAMPPIVAERLEAKPPLLTPDHSLIVSETTRAPYHEKTISRVFKRLRDGLVKQGHKTLAGKQLRDGRRSGFVAYVLEGVSIPFICSMSGHSIEEGMQIVEHYLPKTADQADKAVGALKVNWS